MRAVKISLAVTWLLVLLVAAVGALMDLPSKRPAARRLVYVDRQKLMTMHPAWQQVLTVRAAMAEMQGDAKPEVAVFKGSRSQHSIAGHEVSLVSPSRDELARNLEQKALSALADVEAYERQKISRELESKKAEHEAILRASVAEKTRETNELIATEKRRILSERMVGRLDADLKVAAARSRLGAVNPAEEQKAREALAEAQAKLNEYDRQTSEEVDSYSRKPKVELERFSLQERLKADMEMDRIHKEREAQMLSGVKTQRDETLAVLREDVMSSPVPISGQSNGQSNSKENASAGMASVRIKGSSNSKEAGSIIHSLKETEKRLMSRIYADVTRMTEAAANEHGLIVKFGKGPDGSQDYTLQIAKMMSLTHSSRQIVAGTKGSG